MIDGASTPGFRPLAGITSLVEECVRTAGKFPFGVGLAAGAPGIGEIVGT